VVAEAARKEACLQASFDKGKTAPATCRSLVFGPSESAEAMRDMAFEDLAASVERASS
jgi:hypothetical protein